MPQLSLIRITPLPCPICDRPVEAEKCEPWSRRYGKVPWVVACYGMHPREHCFAVNADDEESVILVWNTKVAANATVLLKRTAAEKS